MHEPGKLISEKGAVLGVAGGHRQPGVPVVAAAGRDDGLPFRCPPADLDGQIYRLTAAHTEDHPTELLVRRRRQPLRQSGAMSADEVMVADVEPRERLAHGFDHRGMVVAEVEDAAVAMAVDPALVAVGVVETNTLALSHHHFDAYIAVGLGFAF